jgi:hypothetical protein
MSLTKKTARKIFLERLQTMEELGIKRTLSMAYLDGVSDGLAFAIAYKTKQSVTDVKEYIEAD